MSESSISTNLTAPHGLFTQSELMTCSMFNFKILLLTITILIGISCLMSVFNLITYDDTQSKINYELSDKEEFGNNKFFSYKDTVNPGYFWAQSAQLTPYGNPDELPLISGQASKIISKDVTDTTGKRIIFYLDLYCFLYVLYGNPFGEIKANSKRILSEIEQPPDTIINQHYLVYLVDDETGKKLYIDKLYKNSDGVYKLKFQDTNFEKYSIFNKVLVTYIINGKETPILEGNFTY